MSVTTIEEFRQLQAEAVQAKALTALTDEQMIEILAARGIIVGATVRDPEARIGQVVEVGRTIKDHSKRPDKRPGLYVTVVRYARNRKGKAVTRTARIGFNGALSLEVIPE